MKVATVCSGIGSPEQALVNLGIEHEIAFACEIDKYARQTYMANFYPAFMVPDMTKETWEGEKFYADLFIGGIPCQAFSLAGKRLGELDPRGLLFYDFYRYVQVQQPKYFTIENVKGLLSDDDGKTFRNWIQLLGRSENTHVNMFNHPDSLEYNLHWKVLNSKDFGVPQNRERVFIIGIRKDLPNTFRFPIGERLKLRLKDILEPEVDDKYYLSEKMLAGFVNHSDNQKQKGNGFKFSPIEDTETAVASCVTARVFKMGIDDNYIKEPICVAMRGRNPENPSARVAGQKNVQTLEPNSQGTTNTITSVQKDNLILEYTREEAMREADLIIEHILSGGKWDKNKESNCRVYNSWGIAPTVTTMQGGNQEPKTIQYNRIRRLTPLECFRLQGFPDNYTKPCSDSQTYKQAGNSITVNVMQAILKNLLL